MKKIKLIIVFIVSITASSFSDISDLYVLGFNTGKQLGTSETYRGQNLELYNNTINLPLGPEYDDYKAGVREGYMQYRYVGEFKKQGKCWYWSETRKTWVETVCGGNVE